MKNSLASPCHNHRHTALRRFSNDGQFLDFLNVVGPHLTVTALWHVENIVETAEDGEFGPQRSGGEYAKHLSVEEILWNAVKMIQRSLSGPTDIERRLNVSSGPVENLDYFVPVLYIFESHCLYRCSCNYHSIVVLAGYLVEVLIEHHHMLDGSVLRSMALEFHKHDVNLQRSVRQQSYEVGLRCNLQRHKIEDDNAQRAYVLLVGAVLIHDEDVLPLDDVYSRELMWQS